MKKVLTVLILVSSLLAASAHETNASERKSRMEKQIQKEIENEKKYSREQEFYQSDEYDFKAAEVNPESLSSIPSIDPEDDFDMEDVYN